MLLYPEVQRYAQGKIDQVVGDQRLPTMEDESKLPYIRCLMKETLRECFVESRLLLNGYIADAHHRVDAYNDSWRCAACHDGGRYL